MDKKLLLARFEKDGFVSLPSFMAADVLDEFQANVDRFIQDVVPKLPHQHVFYEDKADSTTLKQFQNMDEHDPYFADWTQAGPFRELAELVMGGPVVAKNMQYFNKPPKIGKPTPAHQDGYYFMLDPCEALTLWFALDHVDEDNGCVRYVPGSHRQGLRPHGRTQTLGFSQGITDYGSADTTAEIAVTAKPGDLIVHDAMTIHRAGGNKSINRTRRAIGLVYYSAAARVDEAADLAYQAKLKSEMEQAGQI